MAELLRPAHTAVALAPMRRRHLRRVLAIEQQVYPRPWALGVFATELAQRGRCYLVALDVTTGAPWRRPLVGYAGLLVASAQAHITTVAVDPRHHRRKVASRLLVALLSRARTMGASAATLEVRAANHGAQRLYGAFGFAPVGVMPQYYLETGEDAVIMWLADLQSEAAAAQLHQQAARLADPGGASGAPDHPVPWVQGRVGLAGDVEPLHRPQRGASAPEPR